MLIFNCSDNWYFACVCEFSGNGFGIKIVGGKIISDKSNEVGAFVTAIQRGGIADQLHGEVQEGIRLVILFYACDSLLVSLSDHVT